MKKLPIGKQHLEQFVRQNLLYVDKTKLIYELVEDGNYYFLSRPRRFGKSLLVDTLRHIFLGHQDLFKGLWIYDKIDWQEHPVIHLDFSAIDYGADGLFAAIMEELDTIAERYEVTLKKKSPKSKFRELIEKLSTKGLVAVLIDEYDKPITDYITNLPKANANREILREFYSVLKFLGDKTRIVFITGIAKFARVSLFSVLNNLDDISLQEKYAALTGITQEELMTYFSEYIQQVVDKTGYSREYLLNQIKLMYDGYSWDGATFVYNPFSLLKFFHEGRLNSYWFKTGTPTFLIELLRQQRILGMDLERMQVEDTFFDMFNIEKRLAIQPLLFQTGYWTVKKLHFENFVPVYTLGYPNKEVKRAFLHNLMEAYTFKDETIINVVTIELRKAFASKDIEGIRTQLNVLFADISHHLFPFEKKDPDEEREKQEFLAWEGYFQTIIYIVLQYIGVYMRCEITKHKGRLDAVVEVEHYLYILEFKLEDAAVALQQIKEQAYALSYQNSPKEVLLLGIAFDQKERTVLPIEWEHWNDK